MIKKNKTPINNAKLNHHTQKHSFNYGWKLQKQFQVSLINQFQVSLINISRLTGKV